MREVLMGVVLASAFLGADAAAADTYYNFTLDPVGQATSVDYGAFTVTSGASFLNVIFPSKVSTGPLGLGVAGYLVNGVPFDENPTLIDGIPSGVMEALSIQFDRAVRLVNFTIGQIEQGDEYSFSINGGARMTSTLAFNEINANSVTSFEIFAIGNPLSDGLRGNDEFSLKGLQIAAVPLPATLGLLGGALAALGLVRRRRT